ncbi:hypothetical protein Ae201684_005252 [Aphanomyces euteiches]|uniref:Acyltransferase 3 domain-containing protein n=1 Tax=Aphanomyces euteiches TaxID=100861 RepID=A0A6G0XFS2_9STRA|nr:hypothetical protein Ae201684_005252 [Aphanomyces euteiches]
MEVAKGIDDDKPEPTHEYILEENTTPLVAPPAEHAVTYRPDIDGIRALAIVPVVIFHAYTWHLRGGLIGVDIFFVISGYLISGILYKEFAKQKFTYANFYSRRIRRIFPALILVLAFTLIMGYLWADKKQMKALAETLYAGGLFGANIELLLVELGEDRMSIFLNPLLHLWSLGVEEQFYIFWPFFVSLVARMPPRFAIMSQVVVIAISFWFNMYFLDFHGFDGKLKTATPKFSFYFPVARFWQMAIGGILAYFDSPIMTGTPWSSRLPVLASNAMSLTGMAAIIVGIVLIDPDLPFPGAWALLPTLGTAGLILAGPHALLNKYILGCRPLVFIGQISYALYLWHFPLLVFVNMHYENKTGFRPGIATLYLVENQLRRRQSPFVIPVLSICMAALVVLGICATYYPASFSAIERNIAAEKAASSVAHPDIDESSIPTLSWSAGPTVVHPTIGKVLAAQGDWKPFDKYDGYNESMANDEAIKVLNRKATESSSTANSTTVNGTIVVLGDSFARMVAPRFVKLLEKAQQKNQAFPTIYYATRWRDAPLACSSSHGPLLDFALQLKPKVVFYGANWVQYLRAPGRGNSASSPPACCWNWDSCWYQNPADVTALLQAFQAEIAQLTQAGIKVFVATANPSGQKFVPSTMVFANRPYYTAPVRRSDYRAQYKALLEQFEGAVNATNATLVDYSVNQCLDDMCQVISPRWGEPVFSDAELFRSYYARNYLNVLDQVVEAALA